ncbi:unnamed protein product, partial [marine sediment metagenome]
MGNAFIDMGSTVILGSLGIEYDLVSSLCKLKTHHPFHHERYLKGDYIVMSGMTLSKWCMSHFEGTLMWAKKRGMKIVLLGVGQGRYTDEEKNAMETVLGRIKPHILVSRDRRTYENLGHLATHSYDGIDSAAFLRDPGRLDTDNLIAATFDRRSEPAEISKLGGDIVRPHHNLMKRGEYARQKNAFFSDRPEDYLRIYRTAKTTYSDRVHACLVAMVYGNKARLWLDRPKQILFDR